MKTKALLALSIGVFVLLTACLNRPSGIAGARDVPENRLFPAHARYKVATAETVKVWITRDMNYAGSAAAVRLFVDGEAVASLRTGERICLFLPPKSYILGVQRDPAWHEPRWEQQYIVDAGRPAYFRIGVGSDHYFVMPTTETK